MTIMTMINFYFNRTDVQLTTHQVHHSKCELRLCVCVNGEWKYVKWKYLTFLVFCVLYALVWQMSTWNTFSVFLSFFPLHYPVVLKNDRHSQRHCKIVRYAYFVHVAQKSLHSCVTITSNRALNFGFIRKKTQTRRKDEGFVSKHKPSQLYVHFAIKTLPTYPIF